MRIAQIAACSKPSGPRRVLGDESISNGGFELRGANGGSVTNMHAVSIWRAANVAHFMAPGHGLGTGNVVTIAGFVDDTFNASNVTVTKVNDDEFTYPNTGIDIDYDAPYYDADGYFTTDPLQWWTKVPDDGMIAQTGVASEFHEGSKAAKLIGGVLSPSNCRISQDNNTVPGTEYELSFWTRGDGVHAGEFYMYDRVSSEDIIARVSTGASSSVWTKVTNTFVAPVGCTSVRVMFYAPSQGVAYFDDVSFRPARYE